jgi:hypothetical protein
MRKLGWDDTAEIDRLIVEDGQEAAKRGIKFRSCVAPEQNPFRVKASG